MLAKLIVLIFKTTQIDFWLSKKPYRSTNEKNSYNQTEYESSSICYLPPDQK